MASTEDPQFTQIWADAFAQYHKDTGRDIKKDSAISSLHNTDDLLDHIDQKQQKFEAYRNKRSKLWEALRVAMKPVELVGGLTQGALTLTPFAPASTVLGAVLFLVQSAESVTSAYDTIADLMEKLQQFTGRLSEYSKSMIDMKLKKIIVESLTTLLTVFARSEKLIKRGRALHYFAVTFLGGDGKVQAAFGRLSELTKYEQSMVAALNLSSSKRTEKAVEGVANSLNDSRKDKKEEEDRKLLQDSLEGEAKGHAFDRVSEINADLNEKRLSGTGDWILDELLFQAWTNREMPLLWILGGPGAGKSYLSSRIVSYLKQLHPQERQLPVAVSVGFFYIKEDDQQLRSVNTILKSVAAQIAKNDSVFKSAAAKVCRSPENIRTAKSTWRKLFLDFFSSSQNESSVFIVIDGLDEAPQEERETLLEFLGDLVIRPESGERPRIQIVIVGRPDLQIDMQAAEQSHEVRIRGDLIEVSPRKTTKDILDYISTGIRKVRILPKLRGKDRADLKEEIIDKLTQGANGMFLWVNLMLEQIKNKTRISDIRAALDEAPRDLARMIRHVFERIAANPDENKDDLNEMLAWVACAERPLVIGELDLLLKLRSGIGEGVLTLEDDLRGKYASFFTLTREDGLTTEDLLRGRGKESASSEYNDHDENDEGDSKTNASDDDFVEEQLFQSSLKTTIIQFSHASIRDYLRREGVPADLGIGIEMNETQYRITQTCLSIICDEEHTKKYEAPNLFDYAATHVLGHLVLIDRSKVDEEDRRRIVELLSSLLYEESTMRRWYVSLWASELEDIIDKCLAQHQYSQSIRSWFSDKESLHSLSPEKQLWAQSAATSNKELFRPSALSLASAWLKAPGADVDEESCVLFLHYYLLGTENQVDEVEEVDDPNPVRPAEVSAGLVRVSDLSADRITALAKFAGLEANSYWHGRLAKILRDADHVDEAIEEFEISIGMDSQNWLAMGGMGIARSLKEDYSKAVEWHLKALKIMPQEETHHRTIFWQEVTDWRDEMGDIEGVVEASREALSAQPELPLSMHRYIQSLDDAGRYADVMEFVETLDRKIPEGEEETSLTRLLLNTYVHEEVSNACRVLGRLDFAIHAFETAIAASQRAKDINYEMKERLHFANFYYRQGGNETKALEIWEDLLSNFEHKKSEHDWAVGYVRENASSSLSQLYLDKAVAVERAHGDPSVWISKLVALSTQSKGTSSDQDDEEVISTRNASLILGLWYRWHHQHEEAKACFKAKILEGIAILTDDDPSNDVWGYVSLAETLLKTGDMENAATAFAISFAHLDNVNARKNGEKQDQGSLELPARKGSTVANDQTPDPEDVATVEANGHGTDTSPRATTGGSEKATNGIDGEGNMRFTWTCDGPYRHKEKAIKAMYFCEICLNTCFCQDCYALLNTRKLPYRKCDPNHTFYQAYPTPEKVETLATIEIDGQLKPHPEWLDGLKKKWAGY